MTVWGVLFFLLVTFQLKHFLADYLFQGRYMLGKFRPDWGFFLPLLKHSAVHAAFTIIIATQAISTSGWQWNHHYWHGLIPVAWGIGLLDGVIHFFMDRIKAGPRYMGRWKALAPAEYLAYRAQLDGTVALGPFQEGLKKQAAARRAIRGNTLFWWSLGFDQMVHHLTSYGCIFLIFRAAGKL